MRKRVRIEVRGAVQGVGFRPFVYRLALQHALCGHVRNAPCGVDIEAEGAEEALVAFASDLQCQRPSYSKIHAMRQLDVPIRGEAGFSVLPSGHFGDFAALVAPDRAPCADCLGEFRDPANRRYGYPFINCTNCGPRYTLVIGIPYDRARTTMAAFEMCPACREEYENPLDRRFHAEPTCCPQCGPKVVLTDPAGALIQAEDPIGECVRRLEKGQVAAVKGIGGFHLACDAANLQAVQALRERKLRDRKPLAVMVRGLDTVHRLVHAGAGELEALQSPERPIVLMRKREENGLAEDVAPGQACVGLMLPYSPLHESLLAGPLDALVMTSGNMSDEPISFDNQDAYRRLGAGADLFLTHNRDIHRRADDSVARYAAGSLRVLRRSRGFSPATLTLPSNTRGAEILGVGAELSSTACLTRDGEACLSQHIGDLGSLAAYESLCDSVKFLEHLLGVAPALVACDFHPGYASTCYAKSRGVPLQKIQHHHAHIASVLAEHARTEPTLGVALDGMGWGEDGTLWGGEFLVCDLARYERAGYFSPVPLPGGDAAARRPDRVAYAWLRLAFPEGATEFAEQLLPSLSGQDRAVLDQMIDGRVNCPMTSSAGRLFDAAAALLGVCCENRYHAQAPMELEAQATRARTEESGLAAGVVRDAQGRFVARGVDLITHLVESRRCGEPVARCAARFHASVAVTVARVCRLIRDERRLNSVALSGGVFANALLLEQTVALLKKDGFEVLLNRTVPPNDGGISLGQVAVAAWRRACA